MKKIYQQINRCRICENTDLVPVLNLGTQFLTGIFPRTKKQIVPSGPLELVKCNDQGNLQACGLLQLRHSYNANHLYGEGYGYRSGLNNSMIKHLQSKVRKILAENFLNPGDLVIDIGSNDATLLKAYSQKNLKLVGIDPTGKKFKQYYLPHTHLIPDFFSAELVKKNFGSQKAKIITSIAMFYDLKKPIEFVRQIYDTLADDGVWILEQSYLPSMLEMTAYDTICHEHLEYYGLKQIKWMTDKVGLRIIDVELNSVNGGSFSVTVTKASPKIKRQSASVNQLLQAELEQKLHLIKPYQEFKRRVYQHRRQLKQTLKQLKSKRKKIIGYGASTKGNVILQFCGLSKKDIPYIAEVNQNKFGCYTPGTQIPIISEPEARAMNPDYFIVMPWHFRRNIISRETAYLNQGGRLLFPLPKIEIVESP